MRSSEHPGYSNGTGTKENIRAIEQDIERHQQMLGDLAKKYDVIGRTNWQIVLSAVGVLTVLMGGLWGLTVAPINADLQRLEKVVKIIEGLGIAGGLMLEGNKVKIESLEHTFDRLRLRITKNEDNTVSNKEFHASLSASIAQREQLQRQIDTLTRKMDDVFPPQKTFDDLTRRLAELERTRVLVNPAK